MFSKYCAESGKGWDEGLLLLMFAVRETVQESLGFKSSRSCFWTHGKGTLKMLKENWLSEQKFVICWTISVPSGRDCIMLAS